MYKNLSIIDNIQNIYNSTNSLELLLDFERVIDQIDTYTFKNWELGELCEGPVTSRYWVECSFFWPYKLMPDPAGAKRMLHYGVRIDYKKDFLVHSVPVKSYDDFEPGTKMPKMTKTPIWVVNIKMPKTLMSDIFKGSIELGGEDIDLGDLNSAYDDNLEDQGLTQDTQNQEPDTQDTGISLGNGPQQPQQQSQQNPF